MDAEGSSVRIKSDKVIDLKERTNLTFIVYGGGEPSVMRQLISGIEFALT